MTNDYISKLNHKDKKNLMKEYSLKLKDYAEKNSYLFIDPNDYLEKIVLKNKKIYMVDHINPNFPMGIELYCKSVFMN